MGRVMPSRAVATVLYALAALGVLLCGSGVLTVIGSYQRNAATGDFAGASMGIWFLLLVMLPLTLVAAIPAIWLAPPDGLRRLAGGAGPASATGVEDGIPAGTMRRIMPFVLLGASVTLLGLVIGMIRFAILSTARNAGPPAVDWTNGGAFLLLVFSPLLLLVLVLGVLGAWMLRRDRRVSPGRQAP